MKKTKSKKQAVHRNRFTRLKEMIFKFQVLNLRLVVPKIGNRNLSLAVFVGALFFIGFSTSETRKISAEDAAAALEKAVYFREEFFGASASVPLPTSKARENLALLAVGRPDDIRIFERLAAADEKLERFGEAEAALRRLAEIDAARLDALAAFYERRGRFEEQAEVLHQILKTAPPENRAFAFERLLAAARRHDLKKYLSADFFAETVEANADIYGVFIRLIENLQKENNQADAVNLVRQARTRFPARAQILLEKEVEILLALGKPREAEEVYRAAFDPFWSEEEAQKFYDFLNSQDRLRAYGSEIAAQFKANNADLAAAVRLALYRDHDYRSGNDDITPIILKAERAKKNWTTEELVTATRLLLKNGDGENASRFLYTLYLREDFKKDSALRAKIIYQLFEMFSDAGTERLPLTGGDLSFYEDIARADTHPGISTGILSLIFSDTKPRQRLDEKQLLANEKFNRAAAYRIFEEYKSEDPASPELAQMYLDIVRLYAAAKDTEIAEKTLAEFAAEYAGSNDFADAALKLAEAFVAVKKPEKARQVYQKILDRLGADGKFRRPPSNTEERVFSNDADGFSVEEKRGAYFPERGDGINIPIAAGKNRKDYYLYGDAKSGYKDFLARESESVFYDEILEKFVASLFAEQKTTEILALYSREIGKYPDEEWLYRKRLEWLEKANLAEEQFELYKTALARFKTNEWRDKLARLFIRRQRRAEFAEFSENLIEKLDDREARAYLTEFIDGNLSATDFDRRLYFRLYEAAHRRFPHEQAFVTGLLRFYKAEKMPEEWRRLATENYFEFAEIRRMFLDDLASAGDLREHLARAEGRESTIYTLFRADAAVRLSDYETAVEAYRKLNALYPHAPEFSERLISLTRSFGQKNSEMLNESARLAETEAAFAPAVQEYRTRSGEIFAEAGDYEKSNAEWAKLIPAAAGEKETYLDAATVFWDYFQYAEALRTIEMTRAKFNDESLYAFEAGAIFEAKHRTKDAVREYVRALGSFAEEDERQKERAKKRLIHLSRRSPENAAAVDAAFAAARAGENSDYMSLGHAEFLSDVKREPEAEKILNRAVLKSRDESFVNAARSFYQTSNIFSGEQFALARLAEISAAPRRKISRLLQLAESFERAGKREAARAVLGRLVRNFPTNFGVITESANFYRRLGFESEAARVLQATLPKSRGVYRSALARRLADRLIGLNRLDEAERILTGLHASDATDEELFRQLARVCIRTGNAGLMRRAFDLTVSQIQKADEDPREKLDRIAGLRKEMIDAFTRLKDYDSAIAQHIEIINRRPGDEALTEEAIAYVQRYGGAQVLLDYYLKLSSEAFKNYRWNVILARIYAACGDIENAVKNYQAAIINQPEMPGLYLAAADLEAKRNNFDAALKNIDEALTLTNDAPETIRKKIEVLRRAGRVVEAKAEQAGLPAESREQISSDRFAEARRAGGGEKEKARKLYRAAFAELLAEPMKNDLKASDITAYAESLRETDALDEIDENLWKLRGKLAALAAAEEDAAAADEAHRRLTIVETAMLDAVGSAAKNVATDEELANLHASWLKKIEESSARHSAHAGFALIRDLARRAGFGDLEKEILRIKIERAVSDSDKVSSVRDLIDFYNERGLYGYAFDAVEKYGTVDLPFKAEAARLAGNSEKELEALRLVYHKSFDKPVFAHDETVARYLEILHAGNRDELKRLTEKPSAFQLQLINFLIGRNERALAHAAIESSTFSTAWKTARHAETSLALHEFDSENECYFCDALQFDSIGDLIAQTPDKRRFLINDEWFTLTREYGEWLREKKLSKAEPDLSEADVFLPAMTENLPRSADEQLKLGAFYLDRKEPEKAAEHILLAIEIDNFEWADRRKLSALGAAHFLSGRTAQAENVWRQVLDEKEAAEESARDRITGCLILFQTLHRYGLSENARARIQPPVVRFLETSDAEDFGDFQNLIRAVAASFRDEKKKSEYFLQILARRPTDTSLARMIVEENLVSGKEQIRFYELLVARSGAPSFYDRDYGFREVAGRVWAAEDAEAVYEQENEYTIDEPDADAFRLRRRFLEILLDRREDGRAARLIDETERILRGKYARPAWLRAAKINLQIRAGKFDPEEAERFIGIRPPESEVSKIIAPDGGRFNEISMILKKENFEAADLELSAAFFARQIALGNYNAAYLSGLAETFFRQKQPEKALHLLRLAIEAGDERSRETSFREISAFEEIRRRAPDAAKIEKADGIVNFGQAEMLDLAAETAFKFGQRGAAVEFRRRLSQLAPDKTDNKIRLAEILFSENAFEEAFALLNSVVSTRNARRAHRWRARAILRARGANIDWPDLVFDAYAQYYTGAAAERSGADESAFRFFANAQIAEKDLMRDSKQRLIRIYAQSENPFAALRLASTDDSENPDELLRRLCAAAEKNGEFQLAIQYEKARPHGGNAETLGRLQKRAADKAARATDFTVDAENTRKL